MKKKYIPFMIYMISAGILIVYMMVVSNRHSYGLAALEDLGKWLLCGIVLFADVCIAVVHGMILWILRIRKKKQQGTAEGRGV